MCGDATKPEHVERLLDGAEPALMVTDPPYGVNYDSMWRYKIGKNTKGGSYGKSTNDDQSDWQAAYALFPGRIAYVWMSSLALPVAARGLDACGFIRRSLIIWDKGRIVFGRGHYHWRHEPCWYAVKKGGQANWKGGRKASTIWEIKKNSKGRDRPLGPEARRVHAAGHSQPPGRRLRSVRRQWHDPHRRRARAVPLLRSGDRARLRGCVGQAVGRLHGPESPANGETPWQVNAKLHFPGHRRGSGSPGSSLFHGRRGKPSAWRCDGAMP